VPKIKILKENLIQPAIFIRIYLNLAKLRFVIAHLDPQYDMFFALFALTFANIAVKFNRKERKKFAMYARIFQCFRLRVKMRNDIF